MSASFDDVIAAYEFLSKELSKNIFDDLTLCRVTEGMFDCFLEDRGLLLKKSGATFNAVCTIDGFIEVGSEHFVLFKPITSDDSADTFLVKLRDSERANFVYSGASAFKEVITAMFPWINDDDFGINTSIPDLWLYFSELLKESGKKEELEEKKQIKSKSSGRPGFGLFA